MSGEKMAVLERSGLVEGRGVAYAKTLYEMFPALPQRSIKACMDAREELRSIGYVYRRVRRNGELMTLYYLPD